MSSEKKVCWLLFFLGLAGLLFLCQKRGLSPESVGETNKQASQGIGQTRPKSDLDEALKRYAANSRADPHYDWKQPINFFGRVVDENDQSVSGAHVNFSWTDISANGTSEATTSSGPSGEFFLLNRTGKLLTVGVGKPGYYTTRDSNHPSFEYANPADGFFVPDPNNPVVFRLQKMGKAEPLVCSRHLWGFKADGTQYYLDLVAGKKFTERPPAWDIAVRFVRSASNQEKKFDWSMVLEASGGGLIETNAEFMFLAPDSGYQPFRVEKMASDEIWKTDWDYKFFVKSRDGKHFARIECEVIPKYSDNAAIEMSYCVNPNGSRNLEFDAAVQPKQTHFE